MNTCSLCLHETVTSGQLVSSPSDQTHITAVVVVVVVVVTLLFVFMQHPAALGGSAPDLIFSSAAHHNLPSTCQGLSSEWVLSHKGLATPGP